MSETVQPICSWTGVNPEADELIACDRRATAFVLAESGHRVYSCDEHLASAKSRAGSGVLESAITHLHHRDHEEAPEVHVTLA
jgi:hypothetical protein